MFSSQLLGQTSIPPVAKWTNEPVRTPLSSPVLDEENFLIYAGGHDGRLYAFDMESGTRIYEDPAPRFGGGRCAPPLLGPDGTLYLAFTDGTLVAVTNAADVPAVKWRYRTRSAFVGSPAIDEEDVLYIGSKDNFLHAIPADQGTNFRATNLWTFNAKNDVTSSPVVTPLGDIVFLSRGTVFTVTPDGAQAGVFHAGTSVLNVPVVAEDGNIYFGANDEFIYKIDGSATTGTNSANTNGIIFRVPAGSDVQSSAAIGAEGQLYVGTVAGRLLRLNEDGIVWRFPGTGRVRGAIRSALSIGADGTVYVGTDAHTLYAVTADGREKWKFDQFRGTIRSSPVIDSEGVVYFTAGRSLYAIADDVPAFEAPWPQFRGNAQHQATSSHSEIFISQQPTNLTLNVGDTATFEVVAHSSAALFYQWSRNNLILFDATNSTLVITNVQATNAGTYSVSISNAFEPVIILSAQLIIASAPPVIITDLTNHLVSVGSSLLLEIGVAGSAPLFFQWNLNGAPIDNATNAAILITNLLTTGTFAFDVTITNAHGGVQSQTSLVTVVAINLARPAVLIGAGNRFSAGIVSNQLFTWGSDASGQLGDGAFSNRVVPTRTSTDVDWLSVSAGGRGSNETNALAHALGLRLDGSLFAWGANARGQLGVGSTNESRTPVRVDANTNWIQVEAGASHSVGLKLDGTLWAWGGNRNGELGLGHTNDVLIPARV
ncbi:MAG TPA: PQQ-binding-like beta-propeller repeat protein, partial [Candidatus Acidoferrum sp.]|nr:PQQ-binding-like beta-propeller repeat protein [Candidatus Acidoferrum sp.]